MQNIVTVDFGVLARYNLMY